MTYRLNQGFTLIELIGALSIAALLLLGLTNVVMNALASNEDARLHNQLSQEARFAMQRMVQSVRTTDRVFVPQVERTLTPYKESIRDPGVLAVTLSPTLDRDGDGIMDADNDRDGLVNEDPSGDLTGDLATGIIGIDDDNDGLTDEPNLSDGSVEDDDEDGIANEDDWDGSDDDGDGMFDEDTKKDTSHDGEAGLLGIDDDGDGSIDEGDKNDDDEDGLVNEDWLDTVVYFLSGTDLIERHPNLNSTSGTDFTERVLVQNVSQFRVERLPKGTNREPLLDIILSIGTAPYVVTIQQSIRVSSVQ